MSDEKLRALARDPEARAAYLAMRARYVDPTTLTQARALGALSDDARLTLTWADEGGRSDMIATVLGSPEEGAAWTAIQQKPDPERLKIVAWWAIEEAHEALNRVVSDPDPAGLIAGARAVLLEVEARVRAGKHVTTRNLRAASKASHYKGHGLPAERNLRRACTVVYYMTLALTCKGVVDMAMDLARMVSCLDRDSDVLQNRTPNRDAAAKRLGEALLTFTK